MRFYYFIQEKQIKFKHKLRHTDIYRAEVAWSKDRTWDSGSRGCKFKSSQDMILNQFSYSSMLANTDQNNTDFGLFELLILPNFEN